MMPFDDTSEFESFYDFSRQYRNMGLKMKALPSAEQSQKEKDEEQKIVNDQKMAQAAGKKK